MSRRFRVAVVLVFILPAASLACLWDYDTLRQERARFPSTLELITGKFLRHSREFYEWRVKDRLAKLEKDPFNPQYHDDLAVAYQKTGRHAEAVATMLAKEKASPGLYETYSNLGTFYILAGNFEAGLPFIDKALSINPDAHFGRERYQKWLVEYAMQQRVDGKTVFPLAPSDSVERRDFEAVGFANFLLNRVGGQSLAEPDVKKAVTGVLGMMRFADYDNPLLLEALGDLLSVGHKPNGFDAKRMAARAYLMASYRVSDDRARLQYRKLATQVLLLQTTTPDTNDPIQVEQVESEFAAELADANKWYSDLKAREIGWIRDGKNPEAEFDLLYTEEPSVQTVDPTNDILPQNSLFARSAGTIFVGVAVLAGIIIGLRRFTRVLKGVRNQ